MSSSSTNPQQFTWTLTQALHLVAFALSLLFGLTLLGHPARADQSTVHRSDLVQQLAHRYAEAPVAMGLTENGGLIEVLSSEDGATWTIILTTPQGDSRVLGTGEAWTPVTVAIGPAA